MPNQLLRALTVLIFILWWDMHGLLSPQLVRVLLTQVPFSPSGSLEPPDRLLVTTQRHAP